MFADVIKVMSLIWEDYSGLFGKTLNEIYIPLK